LDDLSSFFVLKAIKQIQYDASKDSFADKLYLSTIYISLCLHSDCRWYKFEIINFVYLGDCPLKVILAYIIKKNNILNNFKIVAF